LLTYFCQPIFLPASAGGAERFAWRGSLGTDIDRFHDSLIVDAREDAFASFVVGHQYRAVDTASRAMFEPAQ
jgi:hypothetical protein